MSPDDVIDFHAFPGPHSSGMTCRDVAAMCFMAARLANPTTRHDITDLEMARDAFKRADAFLCARNEVPR